MRLNLLGAGLAIGLILAGVPAMSQPIGSVNGLPVGGQLIAKHFDEPGMFRVAAILEHALTGEDVP